MEIFEKFATDFIQMTGEKTGPISPVIAQSASFGYESMEEGEGIFNGSVKKSLYARMGNPTSAKLESILTHMDGGAGCVATSSGMGAISLATMSILSAGDEVICVGGLFGGTYSFFDETARRFGISTKFFDVDDEMGIESSFTDKTKILFLESVGNPNMKLANLPKLFDMANKHGVICIVDNTVTPMTLRPLEMGADIVVYSTTKGITGNASALGGAAVFRKVNDGDDKLKSKRYPFYEKFIKKMGENAMIPCAKKRALRDFGMSASAFSSYLTLLGLETLPIRLPRMISNVNTVAAGLAKAGLNVNHPSLPDHQHHERFNSIYNGATGTLLTIDFGSKEKAFEFLNRSKLITITVNIADSRTMGIHAASTIYSDFNDSEKAFLGITDGLVRISVGQENPQDIINDFIEAAK
jgi:O-acetylhomoserine (thiol)-lyase